MIQLWNTIFYQPMYNALVWLIEVSPTGKIAFAVVILTILVKLLLSPFSLRAARNQILQRQLQPYIAKIRATYTDKQEQSKKIMEFYKLNKTNPFSGCLLILIQLPIILALYQVFLRGVEAQQEFLYTSLVLPETINQMFFGIDLTQKSIILALLAGITQFFYVHLSQSRLKNESEPAVDPATPKDAQAIMADNMQKGMRFTMPVMITVFAYLVPSAVALYWVISNLFLVGQDIVIRRKFQQQKLEIHDVTE